MEQVFYLPFGLHTSISHTAPWIAPIFHTNNPLPIVPVIAINNLSTVPLPIGPLLPLKKIKTKKLGVADDRVLPIIGEPAQAKEAMPLQRTIPRRSYDFVGYL